MCETRREAHVTFLSRLLSHSSGLAYDVLTPLLMKWRQIHETPIWPSGPKLEDRFLYPLTSEPGTEWHYSPSLDWAGRAVERLTEMTLDEYIRQHIAEPLGVENDVTFYLQRHPEMSTRRADMTVRDGSSLKHHDETYWDEDPDDCFGGIGLFTTPSAFFAIMKSLLLNDGQLLQQLTVEELFRPQLSEAAKQSQKEVTSSERYIALMGEQFAMGTKGDHALGGILSTEDADLRKKGTMAWAASTNISWVSRWKRNVPDGVDEEHYSS